MARTPPVPTENQSPFPIAEAPHAPAETQAPAETTDAAGSMIDQASASLEQGVTAARDAAGPLVDQAKSFVRDRPWTAAALIGTIGLAVFNTLRGKRS